MRTLKSILTQIQAKNKARLQQIFLSNESECKYEYNNLSFYFTCPNRRKINEMSLYINIPVGNLGIEN